jgi:hypothetical protein
MSVYFAKRDDLIKIGWSREVHMRMAALKTELIGVMPGNRATEKEIHGRFSHLRVHGEWFKIDDELLTFISSSAQDYKPDGGSKMISIRYPKNFLERVDKIAEQMSQPGAQVVRAKALRYLSFLGAKQFEAENKKKR